MYHSITFGNNDFWKNTWDDWHLIPKTRPVFNPPKVKTHYVDIPGRDGLIDLSEVVTGRPMFDNRTGSFEFYVDRDFKNWIDLYSELLKQFNGRQLMAILEDDPKYYYFGIFSVNIWRSEAARSSIVIDYNVDPYKITLQSSTDDWIWDTFNFETDNVIVHSNIAIDAEKTILVIGGSMPVIPTIVASTPMVAIFKGKEYLLKVGENYLNGILIQNGENTITFIGTGTVDIRFKWGRL
jgi:hypothetical protein